MKAVENIETESNNLLEEAKNLISSISQTCSNKVTDPDNVIKILKEVRRLAYEGLNVVPHDDMILKAAMVIEKELSLNASIKWEWNPRSTGSADEPDLQGHINGNIVASAEITTSNKPEGTIDSRMAMTLEKLSGFKGALFYCVKTEKMRKRAETKIYKAGYQIKVRIIPAD